MKDSLPIIEERDIFKLTIRYERGDAFDANSYSKPDGSNIHYADDILELIEQNPKITITQIAENLSIPKRTIELIFSKLAEAKIIERKGSTNRRERSILKQLRK